MSKKMVIALVVTVLVVVGAGLGLLAMVLPARQHAPDTPPRLAVPALLIEENNDPVRAESVVEGHRDLSWHNRADRPVTFRLEETDCACVRVLIWVAPDGWEGLDAQAFRKRAAESALVWQPLEPGGEGLTLPPRGQGLVRLKWQTPAVGDHRFWVHFRVDDGEDRGRRRVEVPVHLIEPVTLRAEDDPRETEIDVGRLEAGEERTARWLCWSGTRDKFTLTPAPTGNPHLLCGVPQPLTPQEMQALSAKVGTTVRAGYRLTVTVRERAADTRLDMGPFRRRVVWKTDLAPDHRVSTHVNGTVRGEVSLREHDFIDLGTFLPTNPKPLIFTLESHDAQLRLTVDEENTLAFLQVELLDGEEGCVSGSDKTWRVRARFRTDSLFRGPIPNRDRPGYDTAEVCSVVFLVSRPGQTGRPARRLLVPVRGTARPF
jgi:hypothetical protein